MRKNIFSSYHSVVQWLFTQLPMYQKEGKTAFKKDLKNIILLCEAIGNPQNNFKSIHIAGTNGKGSTAHIICSGLELSGLKVGLYTSPHYIDYRERVKVDGVLMDQSFVLAFVNKHYATIEKIRPSFFEITVALAFSYFESQQVDIAVIETGLGGRLDSTNILLPILSVITNISFDHEAMLGNSLRAIAIEKAGIIKPNCPCLIGEKQKGITPVFIETAKKLNAPIYFAEDDLIVSMIEKPNHKATYKVVYEHKTHLFKSDIVGPFQYKNIRCAISVLLLIDKLNLLSNYKWDWKNKSLFLNDLFNRWNYMGRWQILDQNPLIIGDSAHNKAGIQAVLSFLTNMQYDKLHIVIGFVNDKSLDTILNYFPKTSKYYFVAAKIPRALNENKLKCIASKYQLEGKTYSSVQKGLAAAKKTATENDIVFVGGSIFVLSEVLSKNIKT